MVLSQDVVVKRGLICVVARRVSERQGDFTTSEIIYDVEIEGQEVLHTFTSLDEATQFLDMVAPVTN
ncbi:hypothetical protein [Marinobacter caseinilyticus]|uniref:hypothetical protein n=1 Tax=Marinobacter caseinilyticus TaxID=2692195 RepID=UPI00140C863C|nr:hypothetical protein [Marinobacter caseinilyticus]